MKLLKKILGLPGEVRGPFIGVDGDDFVLFEAVDYAPSNITELARDPDWAAFCEKIRCLHYKRKDVE